MMCQTCGTHTPNIDTAICARCWEAERQLGEYLERGGSVARDFVASVLKRAGYVFETDRDFGVGVHGLIAEECYALRDLLISKNIAYGNAALDPVRIMSKASPEEQILVCIDDKLSRLARGSAAGEDVILDLLGYLILLRVARRLKKAVRLESETP